jgi:hypothetical protein
MPQTPLEDSRALGARHGKSQIPIVMGLYVCVSGKHYMNSNSVELAD